MHERGADRKNFRATGHETPLLDATHERRLLLAALQGDAAAAAELVRSHSRLVWKIAARYRRASLSWEDLVSEGMLGLMEALRRFDPAQDTRFATYACWWIRARIGQYALANQRLVRLPSTRRARSVARGLRRTERLLTQRLGRPPTAHELAAELGVSAADVSEVCAALRGSDVSLTPGDGEGGLQLAADSESPEQACEQGQLAVERGRQVRQALAQLSPRERLLVYEQYFEERGRSLSEIGAAYGVSRQRAGQVLENARGKLKQALAQVA